MVLSKEKEPEEIQDLSGDGSNALILPGSRKNKSKEKEKGLKRKKEAPALSKNKQRKLRKLEEEKKQKLLQAKSIELLGKYKISDGAYSLLHSSGTIGQVETIKEKRRRAVQYSKAGLEVPEEISIFKKGINMDYYNENFVDRQYDLPIENMIEGSVRVSSMIEDGSLLPGLKACNTAGVHDSKATILVGEEQSIKIKKSDVKNQLESEQQEMESQKSYETSPVVLSTSKVEGEDRKSDNQKSEVCPPVMAPDKILNKENQNLEHKKSVVIAPVVVRVSRPPEIEEKRRDLPIIMMEQEIMEAINENSVVILCGETGCGKTTQVPQFLYEAGFGSSNHLDKRGMIGVTQPRRVAVLSTARRVSVELGLHLGREVGFQVRHDRMIGKDSSIKFMTDGILLRELQSDILLKRYSVIILDEAHERSLNTDILIGMLSRIIKARQELFEEQQHKICSGASIPLDKQITKLKLILMSATLRVEDFISNKKLFDTAPPVIEVPVRQFPVTIHFSKNTREDYLGQAYKKVLSIHKRLPEGGILVFVTGQREVDYLCKKLRKVSRRLDDKKAKGVEGIVQPVDADVDGIKEISEAFDGENCTPEHQDDSSYDGGNHFPDTDFDSSGSELDCEIDSDSEEEEDPITFHAPETDSNKVLDLLRDEESLSFLKASFDALGSKGTKLSAEETTTKEELQQKDNSVPACHGGLHVLPLYAMLPASAQLRVFQDVPQSKRLVVVATNVAETSLTIPGIKYVVDTGKVKVKNYCHAIGVASYDVNWISKASAAQRAGRAGRVGPGHCYRLYSSGAYGKEEVFPEFSVPEIVKTPVDGVVLLLKNMGIGKVDNFPFPTSPEKEALVEAEKCLKALQAIDTNSRLTPIGRGMAQYPMSPRHSRMLLTSINLITTHHDRPELTLAYTIAATSALSFPNPFLFHFGEKQEDNAEPVLDKQRAKESFSKFSNPTSDALTVAFALHQFELSGNRVGFCKDNSLHLKTMDDMSKLRKQLLQLVFHNSKSCEEFTWRGGTIEEVERAWWETRPDKNPLKIEEEEAIAQAVCAGWADRVAKRAKFSEIRDLPEEDRKTRAVRYLSCALKEPIYLHRSSSVARSATEFLVYTELVHKKRLYMHGVTTIKPEWLVKYASALCTFSAPLTDPKPFYDPLNDQVFNWVSPSFGLHNWSIPLHSSQIEKKGLRVLVFACALLEGDVLPCLKSAQKYLVGPPSAILRPESQGQTRVGDLLNRMKTGTGMRAVDSRSALREIWCSNPNFLYNEIKNWFQQKYAHMYADYWAQMQREILLEGRELFPKRAKKLSRK
ncbi:RNA helicase family protein [Carex rostrata]